MTPDALTGWNEDANAQAYAAFARAFPMYSTTSSDLARRARLADSSLIVDLCGGTGVTAQEILALAPPDADVVSLDNAAAMQRIGRHTLTDTRLSWVTAAAEDLAEHIPSGQADAVVCNAALWKTDVPAVIDAVHRVLRRDGRFAFNIGGSFAGLARPEDTGPSLDRLIHQIAARKHGYTPQRANRLGPKLSLTTVTRRLADAGLTVVDIDITTVHTTMAERKAWLSIPHFARPEGDVTYEQKMDILEKAYAQVKPNATTATKWLVVVARSNEEGTPAL